MKKRIFCIALVLLLCVGLSATALAADCVSAGDAHSAFVKDDGTLWASGIGELVDGSVGSG